MFHLRQLVVSGMAHVQAICARFVASIGTRYPDLLLVFWLLEGLALSAYLLARISSLTIPFALQFLGAGVSPHLRLLSQAEDQIPLQAAAARVNLGYLMVCGAMALIVLVSMPYIAEMLELSHPDGSDILIWLVVGQAAPIFFGATGVLMQAVDRGTVNEILYALTATFFIVSILVQSAGTAVIIAQTLAVAQLTHAAICAILLTHLGVWPGLTALFHKEIKLF
ncbi:MAG: hypothetical protein V7661_10570 [Sulfitobacter sp.]